MREKKINLVINKMPRSGIRRIMDKAIEADPEQKEIIHLEVGQPQEPTSKIIRDSVSKAALDGFTKYTQNAGFLSLRQAIKQKLEKNHISVTEDNIFVTPGATYGVSITVGTLINHGDEVLVPDPGYPNFAAVVRHYGGVVRYYTLKEEDDFQINFSELEKLLSDKTKLMIINSPSNPTGSVLSETQVKNIVEFTSENNLWLLSDEVYESFVYSGDHVSPMKFANTDHVIGIYSFSKTYNVTGLRIGYIVAKNKDVCSGLIKAQELYISSAPSTSQMAAIDALKLCDNEMISLKNNFKAKLDTAVNILNDDIKYIPKGAFYILIDISKTGKSSNEFSDILLETEKVAVAPGATFGPSSDKYIRVALTADMEHLEEGLKRIKKCLYEHKGE